MNIGKVEEYKVEIGEKVYIFRLDFKALCKFEDKYENSLEIVNDYLNGKKQYSNLIKILSCACVEKDWTEEELKKSLSFNIPTMKILDGIGYSMIIGSLILDKKDENKKIDKNRKNK